MRAALDTTILAYAEGVGSASLQDETMDLLMRLSPDLLVVPVQTLGELYRVLTTKAKRTPDNARSAIYQWADSFETVDSTWPAFQSAFDLTVDHAFQIWDALILSVAAESRCRILLSEDLHHGFTWRGVTVINPYRAPAPALLTSLMR